MNENTMNRKEREVVEDEEEVEGGTTAWLSVFAGFMAQFVSIGSIYTLSVFVPEFESRFGVSRSVATLPSSVQVGMFIFFSPLAGNFVYVMGPRVSYAIGGSLMVLTWLSVSFCTNSPFAYTVLLHGLLAGLGCSLLYNASVCVPAFWFKKRRGVATSACVVGGGVGNLVLPPITSAFFATSMAASQRVLCAITASMVILSIVLTSLPRHVQEDISSRKLNSANLLKADFSFYKIPSYRYTSCAIFFFQCAFFVPLAHLAASAEDEGRDVDERGIIVMMTGVGNTLGRVSIGFFADRFGVKLTGFLTLLCTALSCIMWPWCTQMDTFIIFALLFGYFGSAFWACMPLLVARCVPLLSLASAMGMILLPHMVFGPVAMPVLAGVIQEEEGTYRIPMGIVFFCLCISSIFVWGISTADDSATMSKASSSECDNTKDLENFGDGSMRKMGVELS